MRRLGGVGTSRQPPATSHQPQPHLRAWLCLFGAALLWSTGGAAIKLCELTSWQVASLRSGVAALALLWLTPVGRRDVDHWSLLTGSAYAATMILFVLANKLTTAANAIFLQSTAPLYVLLLAPWLLGEPIHRRDLLVMAALACGLGLFFVGEEPPYASAPAPLRGNLIAAVDGFTWALTLIGLRWISRDASQAVGGMLITGNALAFLVCLPLALPLGAVSAMDALVVAYLGVFQVALAYVLASAGMRHVTALEGALLLLLEPVLNPIWAALVHGERPGAWPLLGGAIILATTILNALLHARPVNANR
jgi:drug/metabolite transporter (DMT)-like permease